MNIIIGLSSAISMLISTTNKRKGVQAPTPSAAFLSSSQSSSSSAAEEKKGDSAAAKRLSQRGTAGSSSITSGAGAGYRVPSSMNPICQRHHNALLESCIITGKPRWPPPREEARLAGLAFLAVEAARLVAQAQGSALASVALRWGSIMRVPGVFRFPTSCTASTYFFPLRFSTTGMGSIYAQDNAPLPFVEPACVTVNSLKLAAAEVGPYTLVAQSTASESDSFLCNILADVQQCLQFYLGAFLKVALRVCPSAVLPS